MTCATHESALERMCSYCHALYCDADNHEHTRKSCLDFLERKAREALLVYDDYQWLLTRRLQELQL
jgi:hypothetical protein